MEKNNGDDIASAFQFNAAIMKMIFGISEREVLKADVAEQLATAKMKSNRRSQHSMIMTKKTATTKLKSSWTMKTSGKCAATMWTGL